MADSKEQGGGAEAPAQAAAGGGGISTGLFLGVAGGVTVLLLAAGFGLAKFVLEPSLKKAMQEQQMAVNAAAAEGHGEKPATKEGEKPKPEAEKKEEKKDAKEEKGKEGEKKEEGKKEGKKEGGKEGEKEAAAPKDFILSEIYVNIKGTRGTRILKASLFFDIQPKALIAKVEDQRPKVIDIVSQILASKTLDQLNADDIRGVLKDDILGKVNAILGSNMVQNIYFLDFVVQ